MNHIKLISQFVERLEHIERNRQNINAVLSQTTDPAHIEVCQAATAKLDVIEAEMHVMMQAIASLN